MTPDHPHGPGRPRDENIDGRVFAATLSLIDAEEEVTASRLVERSGVSRAALYRRWPSLTTLIAAALDAERSGFPEIDLDGDIRSAVFGSIFGDGGIVAATGYSEVRFRHRIRLVMADRALQKEYWESYVSRRRAPIEEVLRAGVERGTLRDDLDVEACFDAIIGVFYYQFVARGDRIDDPATQQRVRSALDVVWRGMVA
ncbi:AcrR family transcriptional regulator [Actinoplanes lutulentus]|uniref:TetR family transcriptional regulator n=1 Tax=Actinoplanes lutulentus TaxID=1287878 RepID=A0A327Z3G5_9ACTN|nr:TetR/AcrR family transcriptional regulator [Actinoplanes lutulentus]MBB2948851.1 AcrR family transcriptional regulator [Actinoplanes lutulentus]RAK29761.1 TetR family transcriptional regulator [Actinoplanes lutulentus]